MKAGVDCGATLTKVFWRSNGQDNFTSTAHHYSLATILKQLHDDGVTDLHVAGIRAKAHEFSGFTVMDGEGDQIEREIALQAAGVRYIMPQAPKELLVVAIGTGTSYAFANGDSVKRFPVGNAIGGGLIRGIQQQLLPDVHEKSTADVDVPDLFVKDALPETAGTPIGEFVVAHFAKATLASTFAEMNAGLEHCVAVSIARDIMLMSMMTEWTPPQDIIFIGTTVDVSSYLRNMLKKYMEMLGKTAHFPQPGAYALAIGAYLSE